MLLFLLVLKTYKILTITTATILTQLLFFFLRSPGKTVSIKQGAHVYLYFWQTHVKKVCHKRVETEVTADTVECVVIIK